MEYLHNGFTLQLADGSFPLSTDSMALAGFVRLPKNARVLDLGSGCGTLGLLLCAGDAGCHVTGIELCREDHLTALENARQNHIAHRLSSICGDLRHFSDFLPSGSFQICVSNPPYFTGGYQSQTLSRARHTDTCSLADLFAAAGKALCFGGDFYLIHKPEMLAQLCIQASQHQLEPKQLMLLRHKEDGPVNLVLMQCRKGAKPGLIIRESALYAQDGTPTDYYRTIYHL